jgi:adenine deaminase
LTSEIQGSSPESEFVTSDISNDVLKIVVKDRYEDSHASIGFIKGFGLKQGAFASSIAHDSNNIISMGTNDKDIVNSLGCPMKVPFMTMSFMALLVIPDLKIGDRGLFDVRKFEPVALFV